METTIDRIFSAYHRKSFMTKVRDHEEDEPVGRLKEMIRANEKQIKQARETLANLDATTKHPPEKSGKSNPSTQERSSS